MLFLLVAGAWPRPASAQEKKRVAVIGAQMVHSDKLQRSQEWPAMFQTIVGAGYDVQNFGDCCSSVSLDYPKQPETHPYLKPPNNPAFKPGYNESVAFKPNIVIIGPWGKHDRELTTEVFGGKLDPVKFAADYETMITTYEMLDTHPKIFACLPIPIPFGMPTGVVNDVILPATKMVLAKHPEVTVIDLWAPFVNHRELYIADTGPRAGTHVTHPVGLQLIADTVAPVFKAEQSGAGTPADAGTPAEDAAIVPEPADAAAPPADAATEPATGGATGAGSGGMMMSHGAGGAGGGAGKGGAPQPPSAEPPAAAAESGSSGCAYAAGAGSGLALPFTSLFLARLVVRRRRRRYFM